MPGKLTAQCRLELPGVQLLGEMGKFQAVYRPEEAPPTRRGRSVGAMSG
jgi:hypothetical protein